MTIAEEALQAHYQWKGKLSVTPKVEVKDRKDLSLAYTPGVAQPCLEIQKDVELSYALTGRQNTVAVITDGTAILGLGDIGPEAGARIVGTGRSDFPNQINNLLAFPGVFRGALDCRARDVNEEMKIAAAKALAGMVKEDELNEDYILPDVFNRSVVPVIAEAVKEAARRTGVARL